MLIEMNQPSIQPTKQANGIIIWMEISNSSGRIFESIKRKFQLE